MKKIIVFASLNILFNSINGQNNSAKTTISLEKARIEECKEILTSSIKLCESIEKCQCTIYLGEAGDKEVVPSLLEYLRCEDKISYLYMRATSVLGELGGEDVVDSLIHQLSVIYDSKNYYSDAAPYIATALGNLDDTSAVGILIKCLTLTEWYFSLSENSATALAKLMDSRALDPLVAIFSKNKTSYYLVDFVHYAEALLTMGWQPSSKADSMYLILGTHDIERINVYRPDIVRFLVADLKSNNYNLRHGAFDFLIRIGDENSIDGLLEYLNETDDNNDASELLNCGNDRLEAGVRQWAKNHKIPIVDSPYGRQREWGSWNK